MSFEHWRDMIRREALNVVKHGQEKSTLVCTGYDPKNHAIKGILVPHGIETGWIPLASSHAGNGFGILIGPNPGDPQKLDGDQFDIDFEFGDPNTPIARNKLFSTPDNPPEVQAGEILIKHQSGATLSFAKDGSLKLSTNNQPLTIDAGTSGLNINGQVNING